VLDIGLRAAHVIAVIAYLGGGLLLHGPVRRALRLVPPGQASILASQVGNDFTLVSWGSLLVWGISGYWMLFRYGWGDISSPLTLFLTASAITTSRGAGLFVMILSWYLLLVNAFVISFVLRPRLEKKLAAGVDSAEAARATSLMMAAARWIDRLALANLLLAALGFLAGALLL